MSPALSIISNVSAAVSTTSFFFLNLKPSTSPCKTLTGPSAMFAFNFLAGDPVLVQE
jgi:hypothetical protein